MDMTNGEIEIDKAGAGTRIEIFGLAWPRARFSCGEGKVAPRGSTGKSAGATKVFSAPGLMRNGLYCCCETDVFFTPDFFSGTESSTTTRFGGLLAGVEVVAYWLLASRLTAVCST